MTIDLKGNGLWGFGERFDKVNQIGLSRENHVYEVFTNQGANAYIPVPFCFTDAGEGLFVAASERFEFRSEKTDHGIRLEIPGGLEIKRFHGTPSEMLDQFGKCVKHPKLPPAWAFGLWISANRWNTQAIALEQAELSIRHGMKPSVIVLEAWSDETTFYRFDEKRFPDPAGMIKRLHDMGIRVILWQVPVFKKLEPGVSDPVHAADCSEAISLGLVALNPDKTPYVIPEGRWFEGSMIPDFSNPETKKWWFGKRQHLLDMGVDGFKTDGGEFVYGNDVLFHDGRTGREMQNAYPLEYTRAYNEFIGSDRVLFSRAGYAGSSQTPMHWAGDQQSTWAELRHVLTAGLNAGLSGLPFWTFDIGGFAGELPSAELYLRAFALACFSPVVQWHSEPLGGQFSEIMKSNDSLNDRSPWNIAKRRNAPEAIEICAKLIKEREKLLPYIQEQAELSSRTGRPMMAALVFDFFEDETAVTIDDEYMFGEKLLVAPVILEGAASRKVWLPQGVWRDYWNGSTFTGPGFVTIECGLGEIPVWEKMA